MSESRCLSDSWCQRQSGSEDAGEREKNCVRAEGAINSAPGAGASDKAGAGARYSTTGAGAPRRFPKERTIQIRLHFSICALAILSQNGHGVLLLLCCRCVVVCVVCVVCVVGVVGVVGVVCVLCLVACGLWLFQTRVQHSVFVHSCG